MGENSERGISAFDSHCEKFAHITASNRLQVWDTLSGKRVLDYAEPHSLGIEHAYTALEWIPGSPSSHLLLGSQSGSISHVDVLKGRVEKTWKAHLGPVGALAVSADGRRWFSVGDSQAKEWNPMGTLVRNFPGESSPLTALRLSPSGNLLVTAGVHLRVWDCSSAQKVKKLRGIVGTVRVLSWLPSQETSEENSERVVGGHDRTLQGWTLLRSSPAWALSLSQPIRGFASHSSQSSQGYSCGWGSTVVWLWSRDPPTPPREIEISVMSVGLLGTEILVASPGKKGLLTFHRFSVNGEPTTLPDSQSPPSSTPSSAPSSGVPATTVLPTHLGIPFVAAGEKNSDSFLPLPSHVFGASQGVPRADSLESVLIQSLRSKDPSLLQSCLQVAHLPVIVNTIQRLPTEYVLPLMKELIERFQRSKSPKDLSVLVTWQQQVLLAHTPFLLSAPELLSELSQLYLTIESRVTTFPQLLRLSGRLDLLLAQPLPPSTSVDEAVVYTEGQSDDSDSDSEEEEKEEEEEEKGDEEEDSDAMED